MRRRLFLCALCVALSLGLAPAFAAQSRPGPTAKQNAGLRLLLPASAPQGAAVRLVASIPAFQAGAEPLIEISWGDKRVKALAAPVGDGWEAEMLIPVPVDARKEIRLTASAAGAQGPATASARLAVAAVKWPEQQITVNKDYVSPPKELMERIKREQKRSRQAVATVSPERLWQGDFVRPVPGIVTSAFGGKRMFNGEMRSYHKGVDLRGAEGVPILALAGGRVLLAEPMYFSGNVVYLDHGQGVISLYCHMSAIDVQPGDLVQAGQLLGKVGATGRVTGPHLHLGLLILGQSVDPLSLFAEKAVRKTK